MTISLQNQLEKRDIELIKWARQWAEYVSDEEVLKLWERRVSIENIFGEPVTELKNILRDIK